MDAAALGEAADEVDDGVEVRAGLRDRMLDLLLIEEVGFDEADVLAVLG